MAGGANGLQVGRVVSAALGLGQDVVALGGHGHAPSLQARLAQAHVASQDDGPQLAPTKSNKLTR